MKHLKKYNENIVDTRHQEIIPMLVKKLVKETKDSDGDLDYILDMVKEEWNKSETKQKPTFTKLSSEEKEQMMSDALKMSEGEWMKKYPIGDHGDYLRMAKSKWGLDESFSGGGKVKDSYVSMEDYDEYIQPRLNIVTEDGQKYFVNLKSDFDDDDE